MAISSSGRGHQLCASNPPISSQASNQELSRTPNPLGNRAFSGLIGAFPECVGALFGAHLTAMGKSSNCPEKALFDVAEIQTGA